MDNLNETSGRQSESDDPIQVGADAAQDDQAVRSEKGHRRHRSKRHRDRKEREQRSFFLWEFRFELLALVLVGLGAFLLLAPFKISTWLFGHATHALGYARGIAVWLFDSVSSIEKSDIGGIVLLAAAAGLIGFDIRTRVLRRHEKIEAEPLCGKCGKQMRRVRTSRFQHGLGTIFRVQIKRFGCTKCGHQMSVWRPPHESDW